MKSTGVVRRVDELGRIVIPIELRNKLGIVEKDPLEIYVDGSNCVFCGSSKKLVEYEDKLICNKCIKKLTALSSED